MTWGRIINGIKYIYLINDNEFKKKSLYDNIYFTLRDIFANADLADTFMKANYFNNLLTNNICFEERTEKFKYSRELHQKDYVEHLQKWLKHLNIYYFKFKEPEEGEDIDMKKYIKFDKWWIQFEELRKIIDKQYEKCCKWEEDDVEKECTRPAELAYDDKCYAE